MIDLRNYNLLKHNTFGIDVSCNRFIEFSSVSELLAVCRHLTEEDCPLLLLGGGSNLLLTGDFHGTVLHSAIKGVEKVSEEDGTVLIRAGSGEVWDDFVAYCVAQGWHGLENLSFIPGEVGASAVQNIGAYGVEAKDFIECVEAVEIATGRRVTLENEECGYAYRQSRFKQDWRNRFVVTHVVYRLSTTFVPRLDYGNLRQSLTPAPSPVERGESSFDSKSSLTGGLVGASTVRQVETPRPEGLGQRGQFLRESRGFRRKIPRIGGEIPRYAAL